MAVNSASHNSEPTLAELVNGLMSDATLLLRQELALARHELYEEARKTKTAAASLGVGIGIAAVGGLLLIIMLVHLLRALTEWPIWTCYGIVGGIFAVVGVALLYSARRQISRIYVVPQQTVETMKENVRWFKRKTALKKI
jgi:Putative Actinobacterial Holin-X, holin superfamily III